MAKQKAGKAASLGVAKLESSGVDPKQAKKLGLDFLGATETAKLHPAFKPLSALRIRYHGPDKKPLSDWPKGGPFYRLRYLEYGTGFETLTDKKEVRYVQEPNTAPVAYYPLNQDWSQILDDVEKPLVITEGELKAIKACQEGFPTIGLGGVYNWRSNKLGLDWLPSLNPIKWTRRNVYICFDSDLSTNKMVRTALQEFADALHDRGAFVHLVALPQLEGIEKVGLDDFLVYYHENGVRELAKVLREAEPLGFTRALWDFNSKYAYARSPGIIVNQATMSKINPSHFKDHLESKASYQERDLDKDGNVSVRKVSAAAAWLKWPLRNEVSSITYAPGEGRITKRNEFNIWEGWGAEPKAGDIEPFLSLIAHLFTGAEPGAIEWFLQWCAYPLQYPGTKMFSSVVLHGIRHGTGKSIIGYLLGRIYGKNFAEINQVDLHNHFNEWAEGKQFVMGDDVTGSDKRVDADFLKKLITQKSVRINAKFLATYVVPDCINYFFTANHPDAFFLEDDDRRYFIQEVIVGPLAEEFYAEFELWMDGNGPRHLFEYLLRVDTSSFNPSAPAFKTSAKERMITTMQSDLASWVRTLTSHPGQVLRFGDIEIKKDLFTSKELLQLYHPEGNTKLTANGVARELSRAGIRQVCGGRPLLVGGKQERYFAVRNADSWLTATPKACASHIEDWVQKQSSVTAKKY
jgi:hypothetical protein